MIALFAWLQSHTPARDDKGATAIEYGLLAALIAIAFTAGAILLGDALDALFTDVAGRI